MKLDLTYTWEALPRLIQGALITIEVALAAMVLSVVVATAFTILRAGSNRLASFAIDLYISYVRGTPLLIQIFIVYYVLPRVSFDLPPIVAGIIALGLSSAAFTTEIMRGGLAAIPKGQIEAAKSLGLSQSAIWRRIIIPLRCSTSSCPRSRTNLLL